MRLHNCSGFGYTKGGVLRKALQVSGQSGQHEPGQQHPPPGRQAVYLPGPGGIAEIFFRRFLGKGRVAGKRGGGEECGSQIAEDQMRDSQMQECLKFHIPYVGKQKTALLLCESLLFKICL